MSKVSVVVTTYNSRRFVAEMLESVGAQTFRDFEIVVADDGSTDGTLEIVRASPLVRDVVTGPNLGIGGNWARAYPQCRGELVAFAAGDDRWLPNHLEVAVAALDREPRAGISFSDVARIDDDGRPLDLGPTTKRRRPRSGLVTPNELLRRNFINSWSTVLRREAIDSAGGIDPAIFLAEYDLYLRIVRDWSVVYTPIVTTEYRVHAGGMSRDSDRNLEWRLELLDKHLGPRSTIEKRRLVARAHLSTAYGQLWPEPEPETVALARKNLARAARAWPPVVFLPLFLAMAAGARSGRPFIRFVRYVQPRLARNPAKLWLRRMLGMAR